MKIIFLSFSDYKGGASTAAYSIFKAIKNKNYLYLTVYKKFNNSKNLYSKLDKIYISLLRICEKIIIYLFCKKNYHQSLNIFKTFTIKKITKHFADIINVHWVNRSMISLFELNQLNQKIVISLHDMWFFSPTQHYFDKKEKINDLVSKYCWNKKKKFIYKKNVFFIAHNKWMLEKFKKNHPLLSKKIFISKYYPINTKVFKPRNKNLLRRKYNIPQNKIIILFSAQDINDERKGFKYFKKIIKNLSKRKKFYFISIGKGTSEFSNNADYKHFDFLSKDKIAELYSLSDIYICTSLIDNLPLTILEALSSGNLVISFKNGGSEQLLNKIGYSFKVSSINKMIRFIDNLNQKKIEQKSKISRKFAIKNFNDHIIKKQYLKIFKTINNFKLN